MISWSVETFHIKADWSFMHIHRGAMEPCFVLPKGALFLMRDYTFVQWKENSSLYLAGQIANCSSTTSLIVPIIQYLNRHNVM